MTLATLLALRDSKKPLPAAAVVLSPLTDQAQTGESLQTKAAEDPVLSRNLVSFCASNYLGSGESAQNPLASPLYGDLHGFPPTILTSGTRDLFLSLTVKVHRKLRQSGVEAALQVFEALSHAQYTFNPEAPETREVFEEIARFFDDHMQR